MCVSRGSRGYCITSSYRKSNFHLLLVFNCQRKRTYIHIDQQMCQQQESDLQTSKKNCLLSCRSICTFHDHTEFMLFLFLD